MNSVASFSEFFVGDEHPMYVQRWGPTPLPVALFSFMAASTPGFVGPLALMVSLVGQNSWLSRAGLFSSSIGRESEDQPRPARSWSPGPSISSPRSWRWFAKSDLRS
jgi:hypothetical protein